MKNIFFKTIFCIQTLIQNIVVCFVYHLTPPSNTKKIIIGVSEISGVLSNMKFIFRDICITVCKNKDRFFKSSNYDICLGGIKGFRFIVNSFFFATLIKKASCFMYLGNNSFLLEREADFKLLKKHKIPIICNFLGSDIRSRKLFLEYCNSINFNTYVDYDRPELFLSGNYELEKKRTAEQADKYATIIFSHRIDQISYLKSEQFFFPPIINYDILNNTADKFENIHCLRILHAPSLPVLKGTPVVRSVIKRLKSEGYNFDYIEVINQPHEEVIKELSKSHIVLNQFYTLLPGIFGLEALATYNAVLMSAKAECFPYPFNNAWIETDDWQIYDNLKYLLENITLLSEYANNGYLYIRDNFLPKMIIKHLNSIFLKHNINILNKGVL